MVRYKPDLFRYRVSQKKSGLAQFFTKCFKLFDLKCDNKKFKNSFWNMGKHPRTQFFCYKISMFVYLNSDPNKKFQIL